MKEDQLDKEIMNYLDGISENPTNEEVYKQGEDLKQILSELKEIPFENVSPETDKRFHQFLKENSTSSQPVIKLKTWWTYLLVAASIVILFFVYSYNKDFEDDYRKLKSNPDKLSFIYNLNNQNLSSKKINWLKRELTKETNPNIKVVIIDLLANYQSKLDNEFYNNLQRETIPTVQMALLYTLDISEHIDYENELSVFSQRKDLDKTVMQKANNILSKQ